MTKLVVLVQVCHGGIYFIFVSFPDGVSVWTLQEYYNRKSIFNSALAHANTVYKVKSRQRDQLRVEVDHAHNFSR
jgi:hypothetical protein